jgi:hypothetical protein
LEVAGVKFIDENGVAAGCGYESGTRRKTSILCHTLIPKLISSDDAIVLLACGRDSLQKISNCMQIVRR